MKRLFTLCVLAVMVNTVCVAEDLLNRVHPNEAGYKIEGDFSYKIANGDVEYDLTNVIPTGLDIFVKDKFGVNDRKISLSDVFAGNQPGGREVMFSFDKVVPHNGFPGFGNISYWYFDPEINMWQPDIEIRQGEQDTVLRKDITIELIIDCSKSLKNDFAKVQDATVAFIEQMYNAAPQGNVHIGIIGFSSIPDTQIFPMQPLNSSSRIQMEKFIKTLRVNNGTALFYAWDKAVSLTESYIKNGNMRNYDAERVSSHFITFTDGIDQTSQDLARSTPIVSADDYYNYIIKYQKNKINNYESDVVFVKGIDITNSRLQEKFEDKLKQLSVPNDNEHYEVLVSVDRLGDKFSRIASRLSDSWKTLNLYVAPARQGHICWTFGRAEKSVPVHRDPEPKLCYSDHIIAVDLGLNAATDLNDFLMGFDLGLTYAYQVKPKFGIGAYMGFEFLFPTVDFQYQMGVTLTGGNLCDKKSIFVGGIGWNIGTLMNGADLRAGFVTRKGFIMYGEFGIGVGTVGNDHGKKESGLGMDISLHFGYNFGKLIKK